MRYRNTLPAAPSPDRVTVKLVAVVGAVAALGALVSAARHGDPASEPRSWTFAGLAVEPASYGLDTQVAGGGVWTVVPHDDATHRRALVNQPGEQPSPAAVALVRDLVAADADLDTRCRGACGLVFRARDEGTHYAVHLDPATSEVVLSIAQSGDARVIARRAVAPADGWRDLHVQVVGPHIRVDLDGARVLQVADRTLPGPGRKGLWAPALGSAAFDVLTITARRSRPAS